MSIMAIVFRKTQCYAISAFVITLFVFTTGLASYYYFLYTFTDKALTVMKTKLTEYEAIMEDMDKDITKLREYVNYVMEENNDLKRRLKDTKDHKDKEISSILRHMLTKDTALAEYTYQAAKKYDIPPLLLTALINTESAYKQVKHDLDYVIGYGGINTKYWKVKLDTDYDQIEATAYVFNELIKLAKGEYLTALHLYKGKSKVGLDRAKYVVSKYEKYMRLESEKMIALD